MIGFEASAVTQIFAGLIAAGLYAAAYLSFVRLMRFPRNWLPLSQWEVLTTGLLAVLAVAWVSLSPDGPDLINFTSLAISTGFIIAVFFIIAAPAIAFRPANGLVEVLARHAEHAGLWLLGPVLVAGWHVPNSKLLAMLVAAMAIELSWFLRQHWARRRLHPLNLSDCSVLEIQANGDLKAFRRRHGIRELVLSEGAVSWRGCGKNTPPCPFNLYVNRLGLNTAPCCREHMRDISHYVAACLRDMGAVHWLEGGSLLGAVRENGTLLDWEDDIDISVLLDGDMTWDRLASGLVERGARDGYHVDLFPNNGFVSVSFDAPKPWPFKWERNRLRGEIRVDIAVYRPAISHGEAVLERRSYKGDMPATEQGGYGVPQEIVLPTSTITFEGEKISCPNKPKEYLRVLYGDFEEVEYTYLDAVAAETRRQADLP
ncbi:MAG: hypothetical protein QGG19_06000 [Alphaproteobacteria bacterium]|jgi:hypothetical protein|nr:hypothetical protein [Rhodospirillaceae bacterium]MDP6020846.1 hypothetical protein [Alphaproteobacteria bacterium]MDP6254710.1 hypothetical protein [Alphaproteobacteria bacterium]MDP7231095.1 hypothetical protein [Alphaproteobacteria bacterium]MDP7462083.1 hypothetical protein [Alphaproteobacteria bacterium]|tara:strand:+ start:2305 stop:3591 length:1287 start_codon:yes stop_codon:yes gene_type:complete